MAKFDLEHNEKCRLCGYGGIRSKTDPTVCIGCMGFGQAVDTIACRRGGILADMEKAGIPLRRGASNGVSPTRERA